jgi:hypothetical protein
MDTASVAVRFGLALFDAILFGFQIRFWLRKKKGEIQE